MRYVRLASDIAMAFSRFGRRAWVNTWTPERVGILFAIAGATLLRIWWKRH